MCYANCCCNTQPARQDKHAKKEIKYIRIIQHTKTIFEIQESEIQTALPIKIYIEQTHNIMLH